MLLIGATLPLAAEGNIVKSYELALVSSYTTYIGGSGGEDATKVAFDNEGNTILIGQTPSEDFPVTDNAFQSEYGGGPWDGFVAKFSSSGELLFSSYIGGWGYEHVTTVIADATNNIVLAGTTGSSNFAVTANAMDSTFGGMNDGFIMRIAPNGTLLYSTFFGGSGEDWIYGLEFDADQNLMFGGFTSSTGLATGGTFQTTLQGSNDAFIARLSVDGSSIQMFSYVGGTSDDRCWSMTIDSAYNYIISGITSSSNYPVTPNAFQDSSTVGGDAILSKLSYNGSLLLYSTLVGGNDDDLGIGIDIDSEDSILFTGYTESNDLAVENAMQITYGGGPADIYLAKFNVSGSLQFLTYIGGSGIDYAWDLRVNSNDEIILVGRTSSSNYPAFNGLNDTFSGMFDAIATRISPDGQSILASSFIGGESTDIGEGIAIDSDDNVVITGRTASTDFPVTSGAYQDEIAGSTDSFVCHTAFNQPTNTTTTTTTTTSSNDFPDLTVIVLSVGILGVVLVAIIIMRRR